MSFIKSLKNFFNLKSEETETEKLEAVRLEELADQERAISRRNALSNLKEGADEEYLFEKVKEAVGFGDVVYLSDALDIFKLDFSKKQEEFWDELCARDDGTVAGVFIDKGILSATYEESMPLVIAAREGNAKMAEFLLGAGANVNAWGGAPLIVAASSRHKKVAEMLIEKGADVRVLEVLHQYAELAGCISCTSSREKIMFSIRDQFITLKAQRELDAAEAKKLEPAMLPKPKAP